jgi:predicted enzyme related to lactoylglutathione lyase
MNSITHFEIYGEHPIAIADFYQKALGWKVEQMPGVGYWRIQTGAGEGPALHGGLTYKAIPNLNGWMLFVQVESLDETVAKIEHLGGSIVRPKTAVPRTAWVTIVSDPAKNIFGVWQADATAFPMPDPH